MNKLTRIVGLCALGAISLTQGCSCGSKDKKTPPVTEPVTVSVSGSVVKGVVGGGVVSAFALDNKGVIASLPFTTTATDALGKYTIKIPETYIGKPIAFKITPALNDVSKLTCDLSTGCGTGINFGDKYTWPSNSTLSLNLLVPSLNQNKPNNISTFTTIAFEQAKKNLTGSNDDAAIKKAISDANSAIATLFGITGDLNELEAIDITDKVAVKAAMDGGKGTILRLAALNAAVLQAAKSNNPGLTFEAALSKFIQGITDKGLASNSSDSSVTDLSSILNSVKGILERVQSENPNAINLTAVLNELVAIIERVKKEPVDVFDHGTSVPADTLDAKALAFANTLRELINSGDIIVDTSLGGGKTIGTQQDKMKNQIDTAELLSSADVKKVSDATGMAAEAIAEAYSAYEDNAALKTYQTEGITVAIKVEAGHAIFTVDQSINTVAVKLTANTTTTSTSQGALDTASGKLLLVGSSANAAVSLMIKEGSQVAAVKWTRETKNGVQTKTVEGVTLELLVDVAQLKTNTVTDPLTVSGDLMVAFDKVTKIGMADAKGTAAVKMEFGATVANTTGEKFELGLSVTGDSKGASFDDIWQGIDITAPNGTDTLNSLSASVSFKATLASMARSAVFTLSADRVDVDTTALSLDIAFGANKIRLSSDVQRAADALYKVEATNQDNLRLTLRETGVDRKVSGDIYTKDGTKKLADITTTPKCLKVTITGTGSFVCLNDAP